MSKEFFKVEGSKFKKTEIAQVKIKDLIRGPYVIRFSCSDFFNIYFAGDDENTFRLLYEKGKFVVPMFKLFESIKNTIEYHEEVKENLNDLTFIDYYNKVDLFTRWTPEKWIAPSSENKTNKEENAPETGSGFNSLLS